MSERVRVRFAPSPTGPLHIGGLRTALFNYLFAKKHGGDFLLRIEDTDQNRYVQGAEQYIIEALHWCGIPYDEGVGKEGNCGPYRQSERKEIYKQYADKLIEKGWAYYAFDTAQELEQLRQSHEEKGETFIYNWKNRESLNNSLSLSQEQVRQKLANNQEYVIRFKMPQEILQMNDLIRGQVKVDTQILDDKVLFKSDGMPTYHLANIVDDHLMQITHVIRGEEWLPSMPLHVLLYRAFEWKAPVFAHLPLILKPVGNGKLSKRDGDKFGFPVFPLSWIDPQTQSVSKGYREEGYLPEALLNFLALLGWSSGDDQEIFSKEALIQLFDLERVHKSGARFNVEKIKWFNHHYLQQKNNEDLAKDFLQILEDKGFKTTLDLASQIVASVKDRATFTTDFWDLASFFFVKPTTYDPKALKKQWDALTTPQMIQDIVLLLQNISDFSCENIQENIKKYITDKALPMGKVMPVLRLSLVGEMKGPDVFEIMQLIGKEDTISRLHNLIEYQQN